jgi:hypothetical protein
MELALPTQADLLAQVGLNALSQSMFSVTRLLKETIPLWLMAMIAMRM